LTKDKISKKSLKDLLALGGSNFASTGIMALFWLYMATFLTKEEYGETGYLMSIAFLGFAFSQFGLGKTVVVYGAKKENVYTAAFSLGLITSAITSVVAFIITQNISIVFVIFGLMIFMLVMSDLMSKKQYTARAKYKIARSVITVVAAIGLYHVLGISGIVLGFAIGTIPDIIGVYNYITRKKESIFILKPKIGFMLNVWGAIILSNLLRWGDKILIGATLGFTILGDFQLALQYVFLLYQIPIIVSMYLLPQEVEGTKNKKIKSWFIVISIGIALLSYLLIPQIIPSLFPEYTSSIIPMQIMGITIIPITISYIYEAQLLGKGKSKPIVIITAIQVGAYFSLLMILSSAMDLLGLALAFLLTSFIKPSLYFLIYRTNQAGKNEELSN